jgi:hypothetical protein
MYPNILHIFSIVPCPKKSILLVYPHSLKYIHLSIFFLKYITIVCFFDMLLKGHSNEFI